jgi:NADPH:quinone reductase-like Zn-dependent oxidoreductase
MRAIVRDVYGVPDVLELREIDKPDVTDDEVLVRVRAASANPADRPPGGNPGPQVARA